MDSNRKSVWKVPETLLALLFYITNIIGAPEWQGTDASIGLCADGVATRICVPHDYMKFELPEEGEPTVVSIGVDIKDIPKVNDKDFSITLNAYFIVKWRDQRLIVMTSNRTRGQRRKLKPEDFTIATETPDDPKKLTAVNLQLLKSLWLPDVEILNLKTFETLTVLSKLEGIWIDHEHHLMYALATRITFICPMKFNAFPMDVQRCKFQVGSFNYDMSKMVFVNEFVPDQTDAVKSILDYQIQIRDLTPEETHYMALGMNYSVAGFEMILNRKMSFYIVTYYLPSGLFVMVSWISFLVNPDVIPGRMTLLVTIFLVLVNIFNTIQTNSPKAEGLTAIEAWVIACIIFVFGALSEYTVLLLKIKLEKCFPKHRHNTRPRTPPPILAAAPLGTGQDPTMLAEPLVPSSKQELRSRRKRHACEMEFDNAGLKHSCKNGAGSRQQQPPPDNYSRTDLIFLVVFPLLFILFNLCYWTTFYVWRYGFSEHEDVLVLNN